MTRKSRLNIEERVVSFVGHGLEIAGDTAIGLGESLCSKATGDLLLDLAHSQVAFCAVIGERDMRPLGKEQHCGFVLFQAFPEVVGVCLGDAAAFAILSGGNGREFSLAPAQNIAVAFLQVLVFAPRQ